MSIITVSRLYGSGGSEVAAAVAHALRWALLDNAVIDAVAERTGATTSEVAAREERMPSLVERLANTMAMSTQEMMAPLAKAKLPPTEDQLLEVTRRVIEEAAAQGSVVIVGRGAQEMLGSHENLLSVFCYAPREALVARCMARDRLDATAAARRVDEVNKQRAEWTKAHWRREWMAPAHYHLCINTLLFGIDGTAGVIVDAARRYFHLDDAGYRGL